MRRTKRKITAANSCALDLARSLYPPNKPLRVHRDGCGKRGYALPHDPVCDSPHGPLVRYTCMRGGHFHVCKATDCEPA